MGRYLDLARRALDSSAAVPNGEKSEKREIRVVDQYQDLARSYLKKICRPDYPTGMVPWLGVHHPTLYDELTRGIPDEIHNLWTQKAPISEFQQLLDLWLEAHRTANELYRKNKESQP